MVLGARNENPPESGDLSRKWPESAKFHHPMTAPESSYQIHAQARGPHWIAWITRGGATTPDRSVILVAPNEEEAREKARRWAEQTAY